MGLVNPYLNLAIEWSDRRSILDLAVGTKQVKKWCSLKSNKGHTPSARSSCQQLHKVQEMQVEVIIEAVKCQAQRA
jgi:hypothetical protein